MQGNVNGVGVEHRTLAPKREEIILFLVRSGQTPCGRARRPKLIRQLTSRLPTVSFNS